MERYRVAKKKQKKTGIMLHRLGECSDRPENMRNRFLTKFYIDIDGQVLFQLRLSSEIEPFQIGNLKKVVQIVVCLRIPLTRLHL